MSALHGKGGAVKRGATAVFGVQNWSINVTQDVAESSSCGDEWKGKAAGLADWKGSFGCLFDLSDTEQKAVHDALVASSPTGALTDVTFYVDDTHNYSGNIIITGVSIEVKKDDMVMISFEFEGNGELTGPTYT